MTLPKDILDLREKRGKLEDEKRSLMEEKRKKREKLKALEQMIIVELNNGNEKARQDLSLFDSSINDLEHRLEQVRREAENQNSESDHVSVQMNDAALEKPMEEVVSTEATSESSGPSSESENEERSQGSEKKKREFY